jgi:hypothetical protein
VVFKNDGQDWTEIRGREQTAEAEREQRAESREQR